MKHYQTIEDFERLTIWEVKLFWNELKEYFLTKFEFLKIKWAYGGYRLYFKCPICGRRVSILYRDTNMPLGLETWACRKCWNVPYQSQRENKISRAWAKIDRILAKLKWKRHQTIGFKSKWMRQATFDRLVAELREAEREKDNLFGIGAMQLIARLNRKHL